MIRIFIIDDHAVVRSGLKQILEEQDDMKVLGEAADAREAVQLLRKRDADVVVLDLNMPGRGGLEVLQDVRQLRPRLPVLVLSAYPEDQFAVRVLKAGASGYVSKGSDPDELVRAVRKANEGGKYVSPALGEYLAGALFNASSGPPHAALTDREYHVLCRIASGKTVSEIAEELCLSVKTVSTYRARILEKMRLRTNAELTHYAVKNGLVD